MEELAVIELGFVAIGLVLSWLHVKWMKRRGDRKTYYDEVMELFNSEWNGEDSDEIYAWYRVRSIINSEANVNEKKLEVVNDQLRKLTSHPIRSRSFIDEKGQLAGTILERNEW